MNELILKRLINNIQVDLINDDEYNEYYAPVGMDNFDACIELGASIGRAYFALEILCDLVWFGENKNIGEILYNFNLDNGSCKLFYRVIDYGEIDPILHEQKENHLGIQIIYFESNPIYILVYK
jgi:hypothetical protein